MAWVDVAEPGARLVYHRGFLVVDTTPNVSMLGKPALEDLRATANAAYRLSELGRIHLVQERLGSDRFAYLAIARPQKGRCSNCRCEAARRGRLIPPPRKEPP